MKTNRFFSSNSDFVINISFAYYYTSIVFLQLENEKDFLVAYDGGSEEAKIIAYMTGVMNDVRISIPGNQMFVVFDTNADIVKKGFSASIIQGKVLLIVIIIS